MKKQKAPKKQKPQPKKPLEREKSEPEGDRDFGGIPNRDLKKNLGCG
jgi:hypothetical protein